MIITKTPFRVSFFGGGTDYPAWFEENGGAVLSTTIDKYCYITIRHLPPFFKYKHKIVYSKVETVRSISEIQHPVVKALLRQFKVQGGVEVHHDADLPAQTGLGSSSSFTVGLLNSLYALNGKIVSKAQLAREAIHIERDILKEHVGSQDQIAVAHGGLNKIVLHNDHNFRVEPIPLRKSRVSLLEDHLMLVFSGFTRFASKVAAEQIRNTPEKKKELQRIREMVDQAIGILNGNGAIEEFGHLLNESWQLKRGLSSRITNRNIDALYEKALKCGAIGGKLLGAGGGGFMLLFVRPKDRERLKKGLDGFLEVKFKFEADGSQVIYYNPQEI
jgi:D-glycero-alpha-D-manno-heptose-7-phosphate kinase